MNRLSVVIADDHELIVSGIRELLENDYEIAGTARDGLQLVELALRLKPDIVILDVSMPVLNGFESAERIKEALPNTKMIFLSMHFAPIYLRRALAAGGAAYALKSGAIEELPNALRTVLCGETYVSPGFKPGIAARMRNNSGAISRETDDLTDRQREILQLIAGGLTSKEIALKLDISVKTVDFHRARMMDRMGARSAAELVRMAVEQELIPASSSDIPGT